MFRFFDRYSVRRAWVLLLVATLAMHAHAQFRIPKVPNLPGPKIPNFVGGNQRGPAPEELLKSWNSLTESWDLDNPKRQREVGQSIAVAISNKYPITKDRPLNEYVTLVG